MTRRSMIAALLVTGAASAHAQTGGPPIAYMKVEGSAAAIYLTRDDGSAPVKLYATPSKRTIGHLDLKPGGGQIAFTEFGNGVPRTLKLLNFTDAGVRIGTPQTVSGPCGVDAVDYHPTEPMLLLSQACSGVGTIATIRTNGSGYTVLLTGASYLNKARWLRDGVSYVYVHAALNGGPLQICRDACDGANLLHTVNNLWWMDVGRQSNLILFSEGSSFIHQLNADTGQVVTNVISGSDGHFSPGDDQVLYETPHSARGDYLHIRRADGSTFRLTTKGDYGPKDWRN